MALSAAKLDGRTNFDIAKDAGLAPSLLSYILNRRVNPNPRQAAALSAALDCEVTDLFPDLNDERPAHPPASATASALCMAGQDERTG